jgi:hypothetical protein
MSKRRFTEAQIAELSKNINVSKCSEKSITYGKKFKVWAVEQYHQGRGAVPIFEEAGFNLALIGRKAARDNLTRWRKTYNFRGIERLNTETRGKGGGRPRKSGLTDTEKIKRMEVEIAYLKAENDFLAKLRAAKKR